MTPVATEPFRTVLIELYLAGLMPDCGTGRTPLGSLRFFVGQS